MRFIQEDPSACTTEPLCNKQLVAESLREPLGGKILSGCDLTEAVVQGWLGTPKQPASALENLHLLQQLNSSKRRMIWILHDVHDPVVLRQLLARISDCSMLINVLSENDPVATSPRSSILAQIQADRRLHVASPCRPELQARQVDSLIDVEAFLGWTPVLPLCSSAAAMAHLKVFYGELRSYLNSKAVSRGTRVMSSHLFLRNALVNAAFAGSGNRLEAFKDVHKGKPALIVATGPSLNKQLDLLEKNKGLYMILAVDPAVPILRARGIVPDLVFSIDPKKRPYWGPGGLDPKSCLVIDVGCCPDVAWASNHKYLVTSCNPPVQRLLSDWGATADILSSGGSVATNAFNLAEHMGANPIVMIGQDLAWTDGKDHADGYVSQYSRAALEERRATGFDVPGYYGNLVRTERQLMYYRDWFQRRIAQMPATRVINATEGGAKIEGAEQISFLKICEEIRKSGKFDTPKLPAAEWRPDLDYWRSLSLKAKKTGSELKDFQKLINRGLREISKIKGHPKQSVSILIERINNELRNGPWQLKTVIEYVAQNPITAAQEKIMAGGLEANISAVFRGYADVYHAALTGVVAGIELMDCLAKFYHALSSGRKDLLTVLEEHRLNRWNPDGTAAAHAK